LLSPAISSAIGAFSEKLLRKTGFPGALLSFDKVLKFQLVKANSLKEMFDNE
jgi:hypothetical protein